MGKREREYDPARTLRRMRNFVVAVLLAALAWLLLSRAYAATRADNALDELYYSTLDSRSCEALWEKGHLSPTVLASALSAYRNDRSRICIEGGVLPIWVPGEGRARAVRQQLRLPVRLPGRAFRKRRQDGVLVVVHRGRGR